ncbi:MAG TPA: NAD(P)/FAD-dependent oxidoreductase [Steroidobacteraceae bacterium]|nr:NAD(P)/FAD-dependent oxidoreductase [Steroidobacteraceae bacterium]
MSRSTTSGNWDVVIAGAGPAGLSAALILGRARRRVLICDTGTPRSWASKAMHGFLSRDGVPPAEFLAIGRRELRRYANVKFLPQEVATARRTDDGFLVRLADRRVRCRKLLIATGVFDIVPRIPGIDALFGHSVFQCPYCDGWEMRDRRLLAYGRGKRGFEMARALTAWSRDVVLCTDGRAAYSADDRRLLERNRIRLVERRITSLEGLKGRLRTVVFAGGERLRRDAMFFDTPSHGQSRLAESLGCRFGRDGGVLCGAYEATSVPGVFVAGNIIRDVQLSIVAAAEGARAAFGINRALTREDFARRA